MSNKNNVILLNYDYQPISTVSWKKALNLMLKEKAEAIGNTYHEVKTITSKFLIPKFLRLLKIVRSIFRTHVKYTKNNIFVRDGHTCQYCGKVGGRLTIDHVLPRSRGGKTNFENIVTSCYNCNMKKANKTPLEAGMKLSRRPYQPTINEFIKLRFGIFDINEIIKET